MAKKKQADTYKDALTVRVKGAGQLLTSWVGRGDTIGVFVNVDLGHPDCGQAVYLPLTPDEVPRMRVGVTAAPDSRVYGLGWRYRLQYLVNDLTMLTFEEN